VSLNAGNYSITFRATAPTTWTPAPVIVRVNGVAQSSITPPGGSWGTYTVNFTAAQTGPYSIDFGSDGTGMVFFDDVRIASGP
jgi:hypothetical protein